MAEDLAQTLQAFYQQAQVGVSVSLCSFYVSKLIRNRRQRGQFWIRFSMTGQVKCSSNNMRIEIQQSYLDSLGYSADNLYLDDPNCRPSVTTYEVIFSFPINACGNVRKVKNLRQTFLFMLPPKHRKLFFFFSPLIKTD